jgi:hypothetical protein
VPIKPPINPPHRSNSATDFQPFDEAADKPYNGEEFRGGGVSVQFSAFSKLKTERWKLNA